MRYYVTTWDMELQRFTPQEGVPPGPYSHFGLRVGLRALRHYGYTARHGDPSVLVIREDNLGEQPLRELEGGI